MTSLGDGWSFCELFWMRSAGFPLRLIDPLRTERAVRAVDRVLDLESAAAPRADRRAAMERAESALRQELDQARGTLRELLTDPRVAEALYLSSPRFHATIERGMGGGIGARTSRERQNEKTAVKYLQRFAAKNETVSFFGPIAWGRLDSAIDDAVVCAPGVGSIISRRLVSFEHWAVQELARAVARDPEVAAQLAPRLSPACRIEGRTLFYPVAQRLELSDRWVAVLARCDGSRSWAQLLAELERDEAFSRDGPAPVEVAEELVARRVITRDILVPTVIANPERALLARVRQLDVPARGRWEPRIRWFCEAADALADGAFAVRRTLLEEVERRFVELTGRPAARRLGEMYAGRGLVYEDCERNVRGLRLGRRFLRRLQPLAGLLDIARWLTGELARRYQARFREIFLRLGGGEPVDFVRFVRETTWITEEGAVDEELREEVADAWGHVLGRQWDHNAPHLEITPQDCADVLSRLAGSAPQAGREVLGSRFHSLDLMVAASADEARSGSGTIVLGELHKAVFLAAQPAAMPFCSDPEALLADIRRVVEPPVVALVDPPASYQRSDMNWPDLPGFYEIVTEEAASRFPPERTFGVADLEVIEEDAELLVRTRDDRLRVWLFSLLTGFLHRRLLGIEPLELPPAAATPRVVLGDVVVRRRAWVLDTDRLRASRAHPDSAERLRWVRRIQRQTGMPDRVFVRSAAQPKPIYIDLTNFLLVQILFNLAHEAPSLSITEMLPGPAELWLHDDTGDAYTSEFRTTVYLDRETPS